jgi:hypothetical protein
MFVVIIIDDIPCVVGCITSVSSSNVIIIIVESDRVSRLRIMVFDEQQISVRWWSVVLMDVDHLQLSSSHNTLSQYSEA